MRFKRLIAVSLAALFAAAVLSVPASAGTGFSDVAADRWSVSDIAYAAGRGILRGVGEDRFAPDAELTRATVVTALWRLAGSPDLSSLPRFDDVPVGAWYERAVAWARDAGVVFGVTPELFAPDKPITREQLATMLYRFAQYAGTLRDAAGSIDAFPDASRVSDWAKDAMAWAVSSDLIKGIAGRLRPDGTATREQLAALIRRFVENYGASAAKIAARAQFRILAEAGKNLGLTTAAYLLGHSLDDGPEDLSFGPDTAFAAQIKASREYGEIARDFVGRAGDASAFTFSGTKTLNSTADLFLAYNNVRYEASGVRTADGWALTVTFTDVYDYDLVDWKTAIADPASAGLLANAATYAQTVGAITPYNVSVTVTDTVK